MPLLKFQPSYVYRNRLHIFLLHMHIYRPWCKANNCYIYCTSMETNALHFHLYLILSQYKSFAKTVPDNSRIFELWLSIIFHLLISFRRVEIRLEWKHLDLREWRIHLRTECIHNLHSSSKYYIYIYIHTHTVKPA